MHGTDSPRKKKVSTYRLNDSTEEGSMYCIRTELNLVHKNERERDWCTYDYRVRAKLHTVHQFHILVQAPPEVEYALRGARSLTFDYCLGLICVPESNVVASPLWSKHCGEGVKTVFPIYLGYFNSCEKKYRSTKRDNVELSIKKMSFYFFKNVIVLAVEWKFDKILQLRDA